jgi:DNA-binding transcriptional LysR family regulator
METIAVRYDQVVCFTEVAQAGSFTKAALWLDRSKAHVSKQVGALEQALGVQLIIRTTRRLALTEAGHTYLDYCRRSRETLIEGERAIGAVLQEVGGTLRITAPTSFGDAHLLDLLLAFQRDHDLLKISLDLSIEHRDLIAEGFDFAIRATQSPDERLVSRTIGIGSDVVVASQGFLADYKPLREPQDLAGIPCVLNTHLRDDAEWLFLRDGHSAPVRVEGRFAANHFGLIKAAAIAGAGVARLPGYLVADAIESGQLVRLLSEFALPPTPLYLVYPHRKHMPHRNRVFRDFVIAWFADPRRARLMA